MTTILVVDDSPVDRILLSKLLANKSQWSVADAGSGVEALALMDASPIDVVVTDLQMPEMDGLELVRAIRVKHPGVPVILVTAHGSEKLAVEALDQGAASYVPKSQLADKLINTVEKAIALVSAGRGFEELIQCLDRSKLTFSLKNDAALIDPLVEMVQQMVVGTSFCDFTERLQIGMALKEALVNALFHGSLELHVEQMKEVLEALRRGEAVSPIRDPRSEPAYRDRRIFVDIRLAPEEVRFVVRDQGQGFDVSTLPELNDPAALASGQGRGLTIMRNLMDEVTFNETGNEVTLVKRRETAQSGQPVSVS